MTTNSSERLRTLRLNPVLAPCYRRARLIASLEQVKVPGGDVYLCIHGGSLVTDDVAEEAVKATQMRRRASK